MSLAPEAIALLKRQVEAQIGDYEHALAEYAAFMADWRERTQPEGRRVQRFRSAKAAE